MTAHGDWGETSPAADYETEKGNSVPPAYVFCSSCGTVQNIN